MSDPLYLFVFFGLFSPGPNVILLTYSGARFGFVATMPHLFGVVVGVGIVAGATGFGLAALVQTFPALQLALVVLSAAWILWMAYKLWIANPGELSGKERPMTFVEAVLFQWVNPKLWAVAFAAAGAFPGGGTLVQEAIRLGTAFSGLNFIVCLFWSFSGSMLAYLLKSSTAWVVFNRGMALALVVFCAMLFV